MLRRFGFFFLVFLAAGVGASDETAHHAVKLPLHLADIARCLQAIGSFSGTGAPESFRFLYSDAGIMEIGELTLYGTYKGQKGIYELSTVKKVFHFAPLPATPTLTAKGAQLGELGIKEKGEIQFYFFNWEHLRLGKRFAYLRLAQNGNREPFLFEPTRDPEDLTQYRRDLMNNYHADVAEAGNADIFIQKAQTNSDELTFADIPENDPEPLKILKDIVIQRIKTMPEHAHLRGLASSDLYQLALSACQTLPDDDIRREAVDAKAALPADSGAKRRAKPARR